MTTKRGIAITDRDLALLRNLNAARYLIIESLAWLHFPGRKSHYQRHHKALKRTPQVQYQPSSRLPARVRSRSPPSRCKANAATRRPISPTTNRRHRRRIDAPQPVLTLVRSSQPRRRFTPAGVRQDKGLLGAHDAPRGPLDDRRVVVLG